MMHLLLRSARNHRHKKDTRMMLKTCSTIDKKAQVSLVCVRALALGMPSTHINKES